MSKTAKFTKEDELLLKDFSSAVSKTGTLTFYAISTLVGVTPIYLFYEVHQMEVADSWFIWIAAVIGVSYLLAQSYKNVKHVLKHQIVIKRGDAIAREMNRQLGDDKKMSKKEKDERILWKKNEVGDKEAAHFTIFYNNILFFGLLVFLSFFLLSSVSPIFNCLLSMYGAAGLVLLFSTAK
ncbi:translocon-associated protein, gamma subunit (TRAP-gamma) domain-containing protein [Ditylenchus destructor]|nr:translocon-associated protein, gamma subunit (TRAP-gamma) domain-containing protein [Ditylenchus destructor]